MGAVVTVIMMYKVKYYMLAICADGSIGNVHQGNGVAYMEEAIEDIPRALNNYLGSLKKKKHGVIEEITKIDGHLVRPIVKGLQIPPLHWQNLGNDSIANVFEGAIKFRIETQADGVVAKMYRGSELNEWSFKTAREGELFLRNLWKEIWEKQLQKQ